MWWGQKHREKEKRNIHFHEFKWPLFLYYIHINKLSCSFVHSKSETIKSERDTKQKSNYICRFRVFLWNNNNNNILEKKNLFEKKERKFMRKTSEIKWKQMNVWTNGMSTQKPLVNAYTFFYFVWKWKTHEIEYTN